MLAESTLQAHMGKHISTVCPIGYADDGDNHCAHFVSHVLGYQFGATCGLMKRGKGTPATIRVHDLFSHCVSVGRWDELPVPLFWGLVFITNASNVNLTSKVMHNVPRKHVGIFYGGMRTIYHYSNSKRQVVSQTPEQFSKHYAAPDNAMFWGCAP